jgi:hypothetical protein
LDPNIWIADTAATVHMTPHEIGMFEVKEAKAEDAIAVGNGSNEKAEKVASISGTLHDKHGKERNQAALQDVTHLPSGKFNLFSLTKMQKDGWTLHGDDKAIWLSKNNNRIIFDIVIPTTKGLLFTMYFRRNVKVAGAMTDAEKPVTMSITELHGKLSHDGNEDAMRKTAEALGVKLTRGTLKPCEACTAGKAKQKNAPKTSDHEPATAEERQIFLDIATVKQIKGGPNVTKPNWRIMVDERTQTKFSDFYETKNGMVEPTCVQLNKWKQDGKAVKCVRLDNAGENKKLQKRSDSKDWKLGVTFEHTARDTPQQNHLAELGFATIANRGRAMMHAANVPQKE